MEAFSASEVSDELKSSSDLLNEWRDWAGLPGHLLFDIADQFTDIDDYVSFGRVCASWQSIFLHNMKSLGSPLLLVDPRCDEDSPNWRALYSLSTKSVCNFQIQLPHSKICRGSSFGWLITMEEKGEECFHIQLQNPFLSRTIDLPTLDNIVQLNPNEYSGMGRSEYLRKAVLSSDPSMSDDYIVMGIMSRHSGLAFFKPGNECWTPLEDNWSLDSPTHKRFGDVIYCHKARQFYALLRWDAVLAIEFSGDEQEPKFTQVAPPVDKHQVSPPVDYHPCYDCVHFYLVEDLSSGHLLQVHRNEKLDEEDENGKCQLIIQFLVHKFDPTAQSWTQIDNLGGKVLFAGNTSSVLRSPSDCPGCLPDHIYYTTDPGHASFDIRRQHKPIFDGVYNMKDGTVRQLYLSTSTALALPATIWLEPTFSEQPHLEVHRGCSDA